MFIFDVVVTSCTITPCKTEKMPQSADVIANVKKNPKQILTETLMQVKRKAAYTF